MSHPCPAVQLACAAAALFLAGCASMPPDRGIGEVAALVAAHGDAELGPLLAPPDEAADRARLAELVAQALDAGAAVRIALANNPRMRQAWARLGIAQADVHDAAHLPNPVFGFADLGPSGGGSPQITRSVGIDLAALLTLAPRKRIAAAELERIKLELADATLVLAAEAEAAWYEYAGAIQVARMRARVAKAAAISARIAQRYHDAGNIDARSLALEQATATRARIEAAHAEVARTKARAVLAGLLGLRSSDPWRIVEGLPAPPAQAPGSDLLVDTALAQRLDLARLRQELAVLEDGAVFARQWRWLGDFALGYERESKTDGDTLRGPTVSLELPLFDQGQGTTARAQARVEEARARLAAAELAARNELALGIDRLASAQAIAALYRDALLPQREAMLARTREQANFMFVGVFELIAAQREQYDAYEAYLGAVRDYWIAKAALRRAAGGRLPEDTMPPEPTLGVDAVISRPVTVPEPGEEDPHRHHPHGDAS